MKAFNSILILSMFTLTSIVIIPAELLAEEQVVSTQDVSETELQSNPDSADFAEQNLPEDAPLLVMDQPMDGSSIESFTAGLEKVDREASEKDYRSLMSALDYLLFYDLSAKRSKEILYAGLDGKTPNEIKAIVSDNRRRK